MASGARPRGTRLQLVAENVNRVRAENLQGIETQIAAADTEIAALLPLTPFSVLRTVPGVGSAAGGRLRGGAP